MMFGVLIRKNGFDFFRRAVPRSARERDWPFNKRAIENKDPILDSSLILANLSE